MEEIRPMTNTPVVPAGYADLGVTIGFDPVAPEDTRQIILGPEGSGKSYLAAGIPGAIVLDFDLRGQKHVPNPRAFRVSIGTDEKYQMLLTKLLKDAEPGKKRPFTRVVFDTADQWVDMEARAIGDEKTTDKKEIADIRYWGRDGAGYSLLNNRLLADLRKLEVAGYAWTVLCHVSEKEISLTDGDRRTVSRPAIHNTLYKPIARNCELIALMGSERRIIEVPRTLPDGRTINTGQTREVYVYMMQCATVGSVLGPLNTKVRLPDFSAKLEMPDPLQGKYGWDLFVSTYNAAVQSVRTKMTGVPPVQP